MLVIYVAVHIMEWWIAMLVSHKVCFSAAFEYELTEDFADGSRHVEDTSRVVPDSDLIFSYLFGRIEKEL